MLLIILFCESICEHLKKLLLEIIDIQLNSVSFGIDTAKLNLETNKIKQLFSYDTNQRKIPKQLKMVKCVRRSMFDV